MFYKGIGKDAQKGSANSVCASLRLSLEEVLKGLKYNLIELTVSKQKGSVQIRAVIYNGRSIGTDDCSKVHRAITPRLELAFPEQNIYLEVSSPGIDRLIKDGIEFGFYTGKPVRCYRNDITEWTRGILESADEKGVVLKTKDGTVVLPYENIAKAKLDTNQIDL
ncbi:MAG: ribosome assembly cofactor RimP [Treponema sp.]|nr:ribosome assembly cofactor RimP [Treponema sp.]MCL2251147.1 ribosome assembly cofactor RimP [Treponema sp.]